jgi:hypothetical protein
MTRKVPSFFYFHQKTGGEKMLKANADLRAKLRAANIPVWVVAQRIGIHEKTLYAWLRFELEGHRLERVMSAIEKIMTEKRG